jgi:hydrogenase maturation protein HypF
MADAPQIADRTPIVAERWLLRGPVQGIGLRPRLARLAARCQLSGHVQNSAAGVEILVEGGADAVERFAVLLPSELPAGVTGHDVRRAKAALSGTRDFRIIADGSQGLLAVEVPPDVAICGDCLQDVATAGNRRHLYPLASCATCGPRYSIIESMPYERAATTMKQFPLCGACDREYRLASDRRFHAQSIMCADCGPRLWATDARNGFVFHDNDAVAAAVHAIEQGLIVALRGVGGYQLLVDATQRDAVQRLRTRKRRAAKPLAIMVASLDEAACVAHLQDLERRALSAPANPILVARAKGESRVAPEVACGLNTLGVMLPTTALHWLIVKGLGRPVVATSGNREGEPLAYDMMQAEHDLHGVADFWLHHDRPIHAPIDDSVVRVIAGRPVTLRLGRGLAPLPLDLPQSKPFVAIGAHQKVAIAVSNGVQAALGPHVGDLDALRPRSRFADHYESLLRLYAAEPHGIAHDLHPSYFTTRWAEARPTPRLGVQHHHAHVVSAMVEHGWLDRTVLGVAFDGTGAGSDGTIWGGEFLLATRYDFRRVGHLLPFRLPGGEAAIRAPWRTAVSIVAEAVSAEAAARLKFPGVDTRQVSMLVNILNSDRVSPLTSSAGRLFDAVAALAFGIAHVDYEGQAAMMLEAACTSNTEAAYHCALEGSDPTIVDWRPMIRELLADCAAGLAPQFIAARFHRGLAQAIAAVCRRYRQFPVVLSGGVFQNCALVECVHQLFEGSGQALGLAGRIPPNDGGLAVGQLAVGLARTSRARGASCV